MRKIEEKKTHQLVLPAEYHGRIVCGLHDEVRHPGVDRTLSLLRERVYWPGMEKEVQAKVRSCNACMRRKSSAPTAPMVSIQSTIGASLHGFSNH